MPKSIESPRLSWLHAFIRVARTQSFSEAGASLGCAQSTITRQIQKLEIWLGYKLFTSQKPPALTPAGQAFLTLAEQIIKVMVAARGPGKKGLKP